MPCVYQRRKSNSGGTDREDDPRLRYRGGITARSSRLGAIIKQRCPRCFQGQVFAGLFRMHEHCPVCGLAFEREPGYFTGAMYLSYGLGIIATAPVWLLMAFLGAPLGSVLLASGFLLVLGSPWLFRYARVLWLFLDQAFDPR
jgi:uncharacterized protein (DUF983 family)